MRILQLIDELPQVAVGGSGRIVWETSTCLRRLGHDVAIVTAAPAGVFAPGEAGVRVYALPPLPRRWAHYRGVFSKARARAPT